jgi:DNA-binding GntR family transcriptional regulator
MRRTFPINSAEYKNMTPLVKKSKPLREQVRDELRKSILNFKLHPGQHLVERELTEAFEVSRTTIREAIRELASEGLVEVVVDRGAFVCSLSTQDAKDLFSARVALGKVLISLFAERATDKDVEDLISAVDSFAQAAYSSPDDRIKMMATYDRYVTALQRGAGAPTISVLMDGVMGRLRFLRVASMDLKSHDLIIKDLKGLSQALKARDASKAIIYYTRQMKRAQANALRSLHSEQSTN